MTAPDVPAIRALLAGITPGPWTIEYDEYGEDGEVVRYPIGVGPFTGDFDNLGNGSRADADAAFIAAAPSIVAQLLGVVERVEALAAKYDYEADRLAAKAENFIQGEVRSRYLGYAADTRMKASLIRAAITGEGQ